MITARAAIYALALAFALLAASEAVRAQDLAPAGADAPAEDRSLRLREVEHAIEQAESRRRGAIGSFVAAGIFFVGGIVATVVKTADNAAEAEAEAYSRGQTYYEYDTEWGPALIGIALAVPIALGGVSTLRDVNRERRELLRKRRELRLGATGDGALVVSYAF